MAQTPRKRTQQLIEKLLDWRAPYEPDADIIDYIDKQSKLLCSKTQMRKGFAGRYAENCGELPTTMLDKVDAAKALLTRWRDARDNGTLSQHTLSAKDLSVASDCLQFIMLPFTRFSQSASSALEQWGALASALTPQNPSNPVNLTRKAADMTQEQKTLCRMLQAICRSSGYHTGIKLPDRFDLDNSWQR